MQLQFSALGQVLSLCSCTCAIFPGIHFSMQCFSFLWGQKSQENPPAKSLAKQNVYNKNLLHISAEGPGQQIPSSHWFEGSLGGFPSEGSGGKISLLAEGRAWGLIRGNKKTQNLVNSKPVVGFGKRGLSRKGHFLEILENVETLEILENPQTVENNGESDHFLETQENLEILEVLGIPPVKRPHFVMTPFSGPEVEAFEMSFTNCSSPYLSDTKFPLLGKYRRGEAKMELGALDTAPSRTHPAGILRV